MKNRFSRIYLSIFLIFLSISVFSQDSLYKTYFDNGQIKSEGKYVNELREGNWIFYFENGRIDSAGMFLNDKMEGQWKKYYESGRLKMIINLKNSKIEGEAKMYY